MDPLLLVVIGVVLVAIAVIGLVARRRRINDTDAAGTASQGTADGAIPSTGIERGLRSRLSRSGTAFTSSLAGVFSSGPLDETTWQNLEDVLVAADVGPKTAAEIVREVRGSSPDSPEEARGALRSQLVSLLDRPDRTLALDSKPAVVVVVGVNGTGKTTSVAKIANSLVLDDQSVVLGAADTFRAAADTQLQAWGDKIAVPVISGGADADPASVAFEAYRRAASDGADVVVIDTAGRLHSQSNLMDELGKVVRVLSRESGGIDEVLLVLDGTVGQNGLIQAHAFTEAVGVTGVVLTKLDGTARGGIVIAIEQDLDIPVKMIGVGEGIHDLMPFVPEEFVDTLMAS